ASLSKRMRERVTFVGRGDGRTADYLAAADIAVAASAGTAPSPGYVARTIASGAVPLAAGIPPYREALADGDLGLMFEPGNAEALAAQIERLIKDKQMRGRLQRSAAAYAKTHTWDHVAQDFERIYQDVDARRHDRIPGKAVKSHIRDRVARRKRIDVDLHMHTDHSHDCATPVEVLLETAKVQGLGAIAITDHNEVSGALAAAEIADRYGVKVIVAEEVKTANQGEVIGLFIKEKIPKGITLQEAIAEIKRQGGLVYVPHPFDRMHSVPDYEHLLDVLDDIDLIEVFNPRVAFSAFNEEAARFAAKYRIVAGAGSDSHVAQGLGSVRINMCDFDGPEEFLESLREADIARAPSSLIYVQALKFLQTKTGLEPKVPKPTKRRSASAARKL
ncbi:MAG: PHP domain-containing protein, partial [Solirubrobacterales bacterium]